MTNPFYDAYTVLERVYRDGAHFKLALAELPADALCRAGTVKTAYGVLEHDAYLSLCIRTFCEKSPKGAVRVALKIALYHLLFLEKPRYMVADTAVDLVKQLGKGGTAGFVNAFLRRFDASAVHLPEGDEGLAVESNYPLFAVRMLRERYGGRTERIVHAKSGGVSVRFERNMERYLAAEHADTPFPSVKLFKNFVRDEGFARGDYTFQSVGSVAVCEAVRPCGELLDACAAPGGKSVLLSRSCGQVTACDLHPHRVALIESYAARMGRKNVAAMQKDNTVFDPAWEGAFGGVLCDVPCSGLGTLAENPDLALGKREEDLAGLMRTQGAILRTCSRYVRAGGSLYYATCSLLPCENDGVVGAFLRENGGFEAAETDSPLPHERTSCGIQFLPDEAYGAGFYFAELRRRA